MLHCSWTFESDEYTLPSAELPKLVTFINKRMLEMVGFAISDRENGIRIDFPNTWKDWLDIKKLREDERSKQSQ
jgi:maltose-binding protein MalE